MEPATITLFLVEGDATRLRTAEISNWNGKAIAAPRTELAILFQREETEKPGVYILVGTDPETGKEMAYIGETEEIRTRLKEHIKKEFWISVIFFISKDENLTKAHIKYLEGRLLQEAQKTGRILLDNTKESGAKLPESERANMEVFLKRIQQLLPILGSDLLIPIKNQTRPSLETNSHKDSFQFTSQRKILICKIKGVIARGERTEKGFVVFAESQAVSQATESALEYRPNIIKKRDELVYENILKQENGYLIFTKDTEFSSATAAANVVRGSSSNGLTVWKDEATGKTLKEIEEEIA